MVDKMKDAEDWLYEIKPKGKLIDLNFKEIWRYRDLLVLFVKRDIVTVYKQTVLGPLWFLIQPLFTSVVFTLVFNTFANIDTGVVPPFLFNLAGVTLWNYFKESLTTSSSTFTANSGLFGKVYFPRFIVPASKVISGLFKYGIQMLIFVIFYAYFVFYKEAQIAPSYLVWLFPFCVINMALLGLGFGMILSSLTTKYRDLTILVSFGINLLMYLSAVMYPLSEAKIKSPAYAWIIEANPLAQTIELYRNVLLGADHIAFGGFITSFLISLIAFFVGLVVFNHTEKTFVDTV
ncbi:lipopolysaccharide transport system permease protein [Dokdonia sp. Hel_I_63]|uniref:ABC transporter permease n=1 Tax=unclassified Dokdonia TaxID=2615033 RepID=UPI00020A64AE|nr:MULTISPECIES: ABC transporter permease [unclassified Dokdonia]AEE20029.1 ABC-2 type transporter [Dokdonia sp. 4H-3-7-5]TVZ23717.1 lipopolysaccharide transport system permease protein [Dokdonia sp. Hel_I_63]